MGATGNFLADRAGNAEWRNGCDSRRTVLKLMAASFGLAGLTACRRPVEHILPNSKGVERLRSGAEPYYYSDCVLAGGVWSRA